MSECTHIDSNGNKCKFNKYTHIYCEFHFILNELKCEFYTWKKARKFIKTHKYIGFETDGWSITSYIYQSNKMEEIKIFKSNYLYNLINPDGTLVIDLYKYPKEYESWLKNWFIKLNFD